MKTHYKMKDLIPEQIYISPEQHQQAAYRAHQKGNPLLPSKKDELKKLIDDMLSQKS